jgi:hypothetical protein
MITKRNIETAKKYLPDDWAEIIGEEKGLTPGMVRKIIYQGKKDKHNVEDAFLDLAIKSKQEYQEKEKEKAEKAKLLS